MSRWLQVPLYLGLIVAQGIYVFLFLKEVWHLLSHASGLDEVTVMLAVLGLIDVVMISNLLIMVIVGGYETFVSRLGIEGHPDEPEWLDHVNAGVLKVKLSMALIGISSIHLLKTFINPISARARDHVAGTHPPVVPGVGARDGVGRPPDDAHAPGPFPRGARVSGVPTGGLTAAHHPHCPQAHHDRHQAGRPDPERRGFAAVHQLLPPAGLHPGARPRLRARESPAAKDAIAQILTNSRMCAEGQRPICQDTGIVTVFLKVGMDVRWDGATMSVTDMINEGVRRGYTTRTTCCAPRSSIRRKAPARTPRTTRRP
jgi:uncharacterized protein (TIGR00645 family)